MKRLLPLCLALAACGGSTYSPPPANDNNNNSTTTANTLAISANGISPSTLSVAAGAQLRFQNNDSMPHEIASNPHPTHTDCPELNGPTLQPGASFTATMSGSHSSCGF